MTQTVPEPLKTEEIYDIEAFFRTMVEHTDSSLLEEWEDLVHPEIRLQSRAEAAIAQQALHQDNLLRSPKAFAARVRAEMHQLVRALASADYAEACLCVRQGADEPAWDEERLKTTLEPFLREYGKIDFSAAARQAHLTRIDKTGTRQWRISQVLIDPNEDNQWCLEGRIDLRRGKSTESPLLLLDRIGI